MAVQQELKESDVYDRFIEMLEAPLYSAQNYSIKDFRLLENAFVLHGVRLDLRCVSCGRESVFKNPSLNKPLFVKIPESLVTDHVKRRTRESRSVDGVTAEFLDKLVLTCSRNDTHTIRFVVEHGYSVVKIGENQEPTVQIRLRKIGQIPSFADLQKPQFKHLNSLLEEIDRSELNKAIGLAAHESAIGGFVYLRRVFERLIAKEHKRAQKDGNWDEDIYQKSRMDEKVELLAAYLPELLVENRKIYGVLSVGIHSLTDELCKSVFEPVKNGIYLMLEEAYAKKQREKLKDSVSPTLAGVQSLIDKALADDEKD